MSIFAKAASILTLSVLLGAGGASAQTAPAATQPCSGTLCDLYYGGTSAPAPQGASPSATQGGVPLAVPTGNIFSGLFNSSGGTQAAPAAGTAASGAPASTPFVRVVGGRPANERCTGTLCDVYYGGSAATPPSPSPQSRPVGQQASAAPAAAPDDAPAPVRKRAPLPQPKPLCHNDRDPWQCFR